MGAVLQLLIVLAGGIGIVIAVQTIHGPTWTPSERPHMTHYPVGKP